MWYTAARIHPDGHQNIHLCLATSPDCVHWRKHEGNPVLGDDFTDGAPRSVTSRCFVRHEAGVFQMWYSFAKPDYRIRYAESLDGIEWERSPVDPVLGPSPRPAWDDAMVEYPEIQVADGVYRLWYCGNGFGTVGYAEGRAESGVEVWLRSGGACAARWRLERMAARAAAPERRPSPLLAGTGGAMDGFDEPGGVRDLGVGRSHLTVRLERAAAGEGTA